MTLEPGWFSLGWQIVVTVSGLGGGVVAMWATLNFARRKELDRVNEQFSRARKEQDERLTRIEEQLKQAPKHSDLVALSQQVGELSGRVARMEGQTERTNNLLEAIHDHLLNKE